MVNNINIEIRHSGNLIGNASYLILNKVKRKYSLKFFDIELTDSIEINSEINISVYIKDYLMGFSSKILKKINLDDLWTEFEVQCYFDELHEFNQFYLDIFRLWNTGYTVEWNTLNSVNERESFLRCCAIWTGVASHINLKNEYVIDGKLINHPIDLYCVLGQVFFGDKGYFGTEINSFVDCLSQLELEENNSVIKIFHYNELDERLSNFRGYKGYLQTIIEEFEISSFTIIKL